MTARRITYVGPPSLAVSTATTIADTEGIDLISSEPPAPSGDAPGSVVLVVDVEGTSEAVDAAVDAVRAGLPAGASIAVQ